MHIGTLYLLLIYSEQQVVVSCVKY